MTSPGRPTSCSRKSKDGKENRAPPGPAPPPGPTAPDCSPARASPGHGAPPPSPPRPAPPLGPRLLPRPGSPRRGLRRAGGAAGAPGRLHRSPPSPRPAAPGDPLPPRPRAGEAADLRPGRPRAASRPHRHPGEVKASRCPAGSHPVSPAPCSRLGDGRRLDRARQGRSCRRRFCLCPGCQVQRCSRRVRAGCGPGAVVGALHPGERSAGGGGRDHLPLAGGRARGFACECVRVCQRRPCGGDAACGSRLPLQRVLAARAAGAVVLRAQQVRRAGLLNRHRRFLQEDSAGLRETRPRLPHLPALWLAFPFVLCPECLFTPGHLGSFSQGRARARRRRWVGGRWAGARGCWGSPRGRAPAGVAAREGRGRRWRGWRGGVSRQPRSPALSSSSSGSPHPLQAPSGAGTSIPPSFWHAKRFVQCSVAEGFSQAPPSTFIHVFSPCDCLYAF